MAIPALGTLGASGGASASASNGVGAAATSGGMGIVSSIINQAANKKKQQRQQKYTEKNMKLANDYSKQLMDYENSINNENWYRETAREDQLMRTSKAIEVQALKDAGFNPALAAGVGSAMPTTPAIGSASSSASAPMGASAAPTNIDGSAIASDMIAAYKSAEELNLMKAQSRKTNADAKSVELDNEGTEDSNRISTYFANTDVQTDENGNLLVKFGDNDWIPADQYPKTKKGMDCLNDFRKIQSDNYEYHSRQTKSELDNMVSRLQLDDKYILNALSSMPEAMYDQIRANSSKTEIEKELLENEKYLFRNLEDGSIDSFEDARKALVSILYTFYGKK